MVDNYRFSENKHERFLELVLFSHLAMIYSDSHLCEQEETLTQNVIMDLLAKGYNREKILTKKKSIEQYITDIMAGKTNNFFMVFEESIKQALPPGESDLYHKLAHVMMKGACIDDDYKEQERRLFQHFRKVVISLNNEEQKKMDYGVSLKQKETPLSEPQEYEKSPPGYALIFVDNTLPPAPGKQAYHHYEGGLPDDTAVYEKDQLAMMEKVENIWETLRAKNPGSLKVNHITSPPVSFALGGHIYRVPATEQTEIIVVGDLHGCYNNLKAVLWQTDFINKVESGKDIYLVLLGDFFDRGARVMDGIMPLVFRLVCDYPERVIVIRGNHEHFVMNKEGIVESAVRPCETITFWRKYLSQDFLKAYMNFFEQIPLMAFFSNDIIFVHAGIPPAGVLDKVNLLSDFNTLDTLDTKRFRYSVLWTDPGEVEDFPINTGAVFHAPFGKKQFSRFMNKFGGHLLIRGHEAIDGGCEFTYPGSLITVFSAGGKDNPDSFAYNTVTPRFLRITNNNRIEAVRIHWEHIQ
jgi:hypothetical protein